MFSLHIGIPGIVPTLLETPELSQIIGSQNWAKMVPNALWQEKFRSVINREMDPSPSSLAMWKGAELEISRLEKTKRLVVSQHALLGRTVEGFSKKKAFPKAEERVARLNEVFKGKPITIHLTLTSQFEYLKLAMLRATAPTTLPDPTIVPSWGDLVSRIRKAAPQHDIVVWDFEQPGKITTAFVVNLIGATDEVLISDIHRFLRQKGSKLSGLQLSDSSSGIPYDYADILDAQYDIDLDMISGMKKVTMIRASNIPSEFFT